MSQDLLDVPESERATQVIKDQAAAEQALAIMTRGDLSSLTSAERATFLVNMAKGLGLNPLTRPIEIIKSPEGRLITYYNRGAADQLRAIHHVNLEIIDRSCPTPNTYAVTVRATLPNGRQDEEMGVVVLNAGMNPTDQANAIMKASTKGKRRVTLSILGLVMLDESEMDTVPIFKAQLEAQQNAPRRLSAPPQAQSTVQVAQEPAQVAQMAPSASQGLSVEDQEAVDNVFPPEARAAIHAIAVESVARTKVSLPQAQVMKRRLPVAPPVVLK